MGTVLCIVGYYSIPPLIPNASKTFLPPLVIETQNVSRHCQGWEEDRIASVENHWVRICIRDPKLSESPSSWCGLPPSGLYLGVALAASRRNPMLRAATRLSPLPVLRLTVMYWTHALTWVGFGSTFGLTRCFQGWAATASTLNSSMSSCVDTKQHV